MAMLAERLWMAAMARLLPSALLSGEQLVKSIVTDLPPKDTVLAAGWAKAAGGMTAAATRAPITRCDVWVKGMISGTE